MGSKFKGRTPLIDKATEQIIRFVAAFDTYRGRRENYAYQRDKLTPKMALSEPSVYETQRQAVGALAKELHDRTNEVRATWNDLKKTMSELREAKHL